MSVTRTFEAYAPPSSLSDNERPQQYIGSPVQRTEDDALLQGLGQYVDDLKLEGVLHAAVLRSPHAHATIDAIDTSAARLMPGVVKIYLYDDLPESAKKRLPVLVPNPAIKQVMTQEVLASREVLCVGDPVAFVVATQRCLAEDACDAIVVEYQVLPAVADCLHALQASSPTIHSDIASNMAANVKMGFGDMGMHLQKPPTVCVTRFGSTAVPPTPWRHVGMQHGLIRPRATCVSGPLARHRIWRKKI